MARWFNTAGPCDPRTHYIVPAASRVPEVRRLVEQEAYFVVHAPRKSGKTTALLSIAKELTREGRFGAVLLSVEVGEPFSSDPGQAELAILSAWAGAAEARLPPELRPPPWPEAPAGSRVGAALRAWSRCSPRPLVVFIDEVDALRDEALSSLLRQIRDGYVDRPGDFPSSVALIGLRDVRDYRVQRPDGDRLGTSSPFNIKVRSLTLRDFTETEIAALYLDHTADTGQSFTEGALASVYALTRGQPWLVNALAKVAVEELEPDPSKAITSQHVERARDLLILRQETHLDSLAERLRDRRVRAVIEPMLAGDTLGEMPTDDTRYVVDLGLVRETEDGGLDVANPIYREVIVRELTKTPRASLPAIEPTWLTPLGELDVERLRDAFLSFWRQHGEALQTSAPYAEVAPHLVMTAFLHRVVNGGGTIEREYAIGHGRMDLCLRLGRTTLGIELKVWRPTDRRDVRAEGLRQLDGYLARLGLPTGWLVIFDQRAGLPELFDRTRAEAAETPSGRRVDLLWA